MKKITPISRGGSTGGSLTTFLKAIGGTYDNRSYSIQQTSDGGYIVAGESLSFSSSYDFLIIKLNSSGNIQWAKTIGGTGEDEAWSIQQTSDGGYIVAGTNGDFLIAKLDSSGNIESCSDISDVTSLISNNDVTYSISNNDVSSSLSINDVSSTINQNDVSSSLTINDVSPTENNICP